MNVLTSKEIDAIAEFIDMQLYRGNLFLIDAFLRGVYESFVLNLVGLDEVLTWLTFTLPVKKHLSWRKDLLEFAKISYNNDILFDGLE